MDPATSNIALAVPTRGSNVNTWDIPLNGNSTAIDGFIGGVQTISVSNANITLTAPSGSVTPAGGPTQAQNAVLRFSGVLTAAVQVTLPFPGYIIIENLTTGAFVLSFRAIGSGQVIATAQGSTRHIYNDGTNVKFVNLPDPGTYWDLATSSVPTWLAACTVPPFLNCDGTTFSATTYPALAALLGGTTLPDLRGGSRATLNQGTNRITTAGSGIDGNTLLSIGGAQTQTLTAAQIPQIVSLNNASPSYNLSSGATSGGVTDIGVVGESTPGGGFGFNAVSSEGNIGVTGFTTITANTLSTISSNTGGGAHPIMPPTTISGITLIRAA